MGKQNNNKIQCRLSTSDLRIIQGIKVAKYCQMTNNSLGFGVSIELLAEGIRGKLQRGDSVQEIGSIFTNAKL